MSILALLWIDAHAAGFIYLRLATCVRDVSIPLMRRRVILLILRRLRRTVVGHVSRLLFVDVLPPYFRVALFRVLEDFLACDKTHNVSEGGVADEVCNHILIDASLGEDLVQS